MTSAKLPGRSVTRSANWLKCAHTSVAPGKRSGVRNASRTSTTVTANPSVQASRATGAASCPAPKITRSGGGIVIS